MKEFDLKAAKAGKAVCTRDGRAARIICWDKKDKDNLLKTPIIALIDINGDEIIRYYDKNGIDPISSNSADYLMMTSEKKEGWVNLYKEKDGSLGCSMIRCSKEEAVSHIIHKRIYVDTVKIEWEE